MEHLERAESSGEEFDTTPTVEASASAVLPNSQPFIGQWNRVISRTNWEKGAIVCQWRAQLLADGFGPRQASDEVWSRLAAGVSPQHVGRLRRTSERFGGTYDSYRGLYWSHFYAALDWPDAEMWLEGAVQNEWSVAEMREQRWEVLGLPESQRPQPDPIDVDPIEEEAEPVRGRQQTERASEPGFQSEPLAEGPDFGDSNPLVPGERAGASGDWIGDESTEAQPAVRLFEPFRNLPDDLDEATRLFKLAIVRHKAAAWREIPLDQVIGLLDALKRLAEYPPNADKPDRIGSPKG